MARKFTADRLVIASHNAGKIREMVDLRAPYDVAVSGAGELGLAEPEETGTTFLANAELKARAAATASRRAAGPRAERSFGTRWREPLRTASRPMRMRPRS